MNADLLRATVEVIARHPQDFDMGIGIVRKPRSLKQWFHDEPCGTVCCLAGQCFMSLNGIHADDYVKRTAKSAGEQADWQAVRKFATKAFDITNKQADKLYFVSGWPRQFSAAYALAQTDADRVEALRGAVEDFIATNGWEPEVRVSIKDGQLVESQG